MLPVSPGYPVIIKGILNREVLISSMDVKSGEKLLSVSKIDDLKTWLSTALTHQRQQQFGYSFKDLRDIGEIQSSDPHFTNANNSLAIVLKISGILGKFNLPIHRKLLGEFPEWVNPGVRRLLQAGRPTPNVTVALDGTGDVKTIKEAMRMVPKKSNAIFIIYIKEGVYVEQWRMWFWTNRSGTS
ncbi:hypothetical protein LXL04_009953 [Taraxacum kok-saghyz]